MLPLVPKGRQGAMVLPLVPCFQGLRVTLGAVLTSPAAAQGIKWCGGMC